MDDLLREFREPMVIIDYFEFFKGVVDYRGDFNGFEMHEEFSELDNYREHLNLIKNKALDKLVVCNDLLIIRDLLLSIKSRYDVKEDCVTHNNINYKQTGLVESFKTQKCKWKAFHPDDISSFLRIQYEWLLFLISEINMRLSKLETGIQEKKQVTKIKITKENLNKFHPFFKSFFSESDYQSLYRLLNNEYINSRLHFNGKSNQLIDAFRRLLVNKVIVVEKKTMFKDWIVKNFTYGASVINASGFKPDHVLNVLCKSDVNYKCKKPIVDFENEYPYKDNFFK